MGTLKVLVIPCKTFRERMRLTKQYIDKYFIENMGSYLYLVRR
ncbi:hypothetical protein [Clostridium niameyense]|nr:hypothetical protein [Clostridium niameyense]